MRLFALAVVLALACACSIEAYTTPVTVAALLKAKQVLTAHGPNWRAATADWVCDGPPGGPGCDPCAPGGDAGDEWWSKWSHIACRGPNSYLDDTPGGDGRVTNIHFTQGGVEGGWGDPRGDPAAIIDALCDVGKAGGVHEVDITSSMRNADPYRIAGPLPPSFKACFPGVHQFEWSYNALNGSLPTWIVDMPNLSYFKMRANEFTGALPPAYGTMPQLFRLDLGRNKLSGPIPATFANHPTLGILQLDGNDFEGDLVGALAGTHLQVAMVSPNPKLCGAIPEHVRFAVGFNTTGTGLGKPCPRGVGVSEPLAGEVDKSGGAAPAVAAQQGKAAGGAAPAVAAQQGKAAPLAGEVDKSGGAAPAVAAQQGKAAPAA